MSSSASPFRWLLYNPESEQALHDPGPVWGINGRHKDQIELSGRLVLVKDDGSSEIYARCKYE